MSFTVARRGGINRDVFAPYFRMLRQFGVPMDRLNRVPEPGTHSRWLHVWPSREEAVEFRKAVVKDSHPRDKNWYVHELTEEEEKLVNEGPLGPITISVGMQSHGWTFGLETFSKLLIRMKYPEKTLLKCVFVGFKDAKNNSPPVPSPDLFFAQIASLLTGLGKTELDCFGRYLFSHPSRNSYRELFRQTTISMENRRPLAPVVTKLMQ